MGGMTSEELELFNERAGIAEHDGQQSRKDAERLARDEVERHRFRCEVRWLIRKAKNEGTSASDLYLLGCEKQRGAEATARLREAAREQWLKGNLGAEGDWR